MDIQNINWQSIIISKLYKHITEMMILKRIVFETYLVSIFVRELELELLNHRLIDKCLIYIWGNLCVYWDLICLCFLFQSITIPTNVTSIGNSTFNHCSHLQSITVESTNFLFTSIEGILFSNDFATIIFFHQITNIWHIIFQQMLHQLVIMLFIIVLIYTQFLFLIFWTF